MIRKKTSEYSIQYLLLKVFFVFFRSQHNVEFRTVGDLNSVDPRVFSILVDSSAILDDFFIDLSN